MVVKITEQDIQHMVFETIKQMKNMLTEGRPPKWTYETCKELASKCASRGQFRADYNDAYQAACKYGWIDEFFGPSNVKPKGYWTYETCKELASQCASRGQFRADYNDAYQAAYKHGWLDELFPEDLSYERCKELASKCKTIGKFAAKYYKA